MDINQRIGDYEILGELGSGGMGRVFRVRNVISDRIEAMKVLLPDLEGRQDLAARFLREIKLLATLNHPNIAALRTALTADNQLVMIMEYVEGPSLAGRLAQGPIPCGEALAYVDQVLEALAYAHAQEIVHRDVKPANMIVTPQGTVKLTDFGIARSPHDQSLTVTGTTTGSLSYMPPEQVRGDHTDARSDLYAVGISLYEMVTGRRPFEADSNFAIMMAHVNEKPRPPAELQPSLPAGINEIILKAMAKEPSARFQSAAEFRAALRAIAGAGRDPVPSPISIEPVTGTKPRHQRTPGASADARTVPPRTSVDQPTPHAAAIAGAEIPVARVRAAHPFAYVALGGVLMIVALVGTGLYLGRAEAGPDGADQSSAAPATRVAAASPAASTTSAAPAPDPAPAGPPTDAAPSTSVPDRLAPLDTHPAAATEPKGSESIGPAAAIPATANPAVAPAAPAPASMAGAARAKSGDAVTRPAAPRPLEITAPPSAAGSASAAEAPVSPLRTPDENAASRSDVERQPPSLDTRALDEVETAIDQLTVRAAVVNRSLDRLEQEQARQGLGLRSDMAARQESMNINLTRAREAVEKEDAARADKYRLAAERDIEALEGFLGR